MIEAGTGENRGAGLYAPQPGGGDRGPLGIVGNDINGRGRLHRLGEEPLFDRGAGPTGNQYGLGPGGKAQDQGEVVGAPDVGFRARIEDVVIERVTEGSVIAGL